MVPDETVSMIGVTLYDLAQKLTELTGGKIMIGWALKNENEIIEGAVGSAGLDYETASKMYLGIGSYIGNHYGKHGELNPLTNQTNDK